MSISRLPSRRRRATHACAALVASLVLAACGGGDDDGASGGGPVPAGEGAGATAPEGGAPENPVSPRPGSGGGQVPAEDVAEVKRALQVIRTCRRGAAQDRALRDAVTTVIVAYQANGPDARYEANDTLTPVNMRDIAEQARAALARCGAPEQLRRLDAALAGS
ncbi:MAG: hypothetical protein QOC64_1276 [Solirubrobacteraceae bacterium]|nr:hypothetical protein [Solirubrobacteraceae bacterium]